jgi:sugar lactone lactonase YvrE
MRVDDMARFERLPVWRHAVAASLLLSLAGCGTTASSPGQAALSSAPAPTQAPSAPASAGPTPLVAPSMAVEPSLKTVWTKSGPLLHEFSGPGTPSVDATGRIWASSSAENVFWIFNRDGKYLESWGTPGSGDGQFKLFVDGGGFGAVAFRSDRGFYVADAGNFRVQQFDKDRKFVRAWGSFGTKDGQFTVLNDIVTDGSGHVYVLDGSRQDVQEFDADGAFVRIVAKDVGPYLGVDSKGNVTAVDNRTVLLQTFAPDGSRTLAIDLRSVCSFATGIDVRPNGEIFVASSTSGGSSFEYEHLIELDATGKVLHVWPNGAEGIVVDPAGDRVYTTFSDNKPAVRAFALPRA